MSDIICVTNRRLCRDEFLERIGKIAKAGPKAVILREKDLSGEEYKALASQVMAICEEYKIPCVLHSFYREALELGAEAVHMPLPMLRLMSREERSDFSVIGASCHSIEEALEAEGLGCSYITAGHIFDTGCKKGVPGRGLKFLEDICGIVSIPVYAIGGVSGGNIRAVPGTGAAGACVMSGLMECREPEEYMRILKNGGE